ncbi:MAG: PHP domain-containing protein [Anaerolineae bacterium]
MRIDLHCHTHYSPDALNTFDALLHRMDQRGLEMVAITDHNTIRGALEFHRRAPDRFLVGEEIKTRQGELIALFLEEEVPPDLSIHETISQVHAQGGLVGASHPLDRLRSEAMGRVILESIHEQLDFIEVLNARTIVFKDNRLTREMTIRWGLPASAGSDAHAPFEIGRVYVQMPRFENRQEFLDCLAQGQIGGRPSSPLVHLISRYAKWRKCLGI